MRTNKLPAIPKILKHSKTPKRVEPPKRVVVYEKKAPSAILKEMLELFIGSDNYIQVDSLGQLINWYVEEVYSFHESIHVSKKRLESLKQRVLDLKREKAATFVSDLKNELGVNFKDLDNYEMRCYNKTLELNKDGSKCGGDLIDISVMLENKEESPIHLINPLLENKEEKSVGRSLKAFEDLEEEDLTEKDTFSDVVESLKWYSLNDFVVLNKDGSKCGEDFSFNLKKVF